MRVLPGPALVGGTKTCDRDNAENRDTKNVLIAATDVSSNVFCQWLSFRLRLFEIPLSDAGSVPPYSPPFEPRSTGHFRDPVC